MNSKNSKTLQTLLYSVVGVIGVLIILVAANAILAKINVRADLTQEKIYTLSEGTREILKNLEEPVSLRFYVTQDDNAMPVTLRSYANRVTEMLEEFQQVNPDMIELEILNPEPFSQAEDSATLDGVQAQPISLQEQIYLGLAVASGGEKVAIPFLDPRQEPTLEYEVARAIAAVTTLEKPVIGVMAGLPVFGTPQMPPQMMQQMPQQNPWIFIQELRNRFEVREIGLDEAEIPADVNMLILLHPNEISDEAKYAVDQFLMRGGKLAVFVDPFAFVSTFLQPQNQMMMGVPPGGSSNLPELFAAWGVEFSNEVVADRTLRTMLGGPGGQPEEMPGVLSLTSQNLNTDDVVTADIDSLVMLFAGAVTLQEKDGLSHSVLAHSTDQSMLVDAFRAQRESEAILNEFEPSGQEMPLVVRLNGRFQSAYAAPPTAGEEETDAEGSEEGEDAAAAEDAEEESAGPHLAASQQESTVFIVGDVDFIFDSFAVEIQQILGQQLIYPRNGNLSLALNIVDQLAGDQNLIKIRSRGTLTRPFTVIQDITAQADEQYRERIVQIEQQIEQANRRLNELQAGKAEGEEFIISPEQEREIEKFQTQLVQFRQDLRQLERRRRQDIESLQTSLKWWNILAMPLVVIGVGVGTAVWRRRRQSARAES